MVYPTQCTSICNINVSSQHEKSKISLHYLHLACGTEESPTLPPRCIPAEGLRPKFTTREEGRITKRHCYGTH